jgi:glucose/arabinose dehydrogenase
VHFVVAACLLLLGTVSCSAQTDVQMEGVEIQPAFPNLSFERPVDFQQPDDGTDRVFVVEQAGTIYVFENDASVESAEVFLDIEEKVSRQGNEEGLLGLAFHPQFSSNNYFYVYYSAANPRRSVVARYEVDPNNPDRALEDSETILMEIAQPYGNHNGGQISFGPDGYVYIGLGDGGSGGDPQNNGQDPSTLLGSIIRIDVDNPADGQLYGIPNDNPFVDNTEGYREEVYAYGLRNPWRFSWDAETGQMWTGDVGQNAYEEVDIVEKGENYGWNIMEGTHCYEPETGCDRSGLVLPIVEYPREEGVSVTGGFVYRGSDVPALEGKYVYADYASGKIWALTFDDKEAVENELLSNSDLAISSFGVDRESELYICAFDGKIYRFAP